MIKPLSLITALGIVLAGLPVTANDLLSDDFTLAADSAGEVWLGRIFGSDITIAHWADGRWIDKWSLTVSGSLSNLELVEIGGNLLASWIEESSTTGRLAFALLDREKPVLLRPEALRGDFEQFSIVHLREKEIGLLLVENSSNTNKIRWIEFCLDRNELLAGIELSRAPHISCPTIASGELEWLCWQESDAGRLKIAVSTLPEKGRSSSKRFIAKGFGGDASPVLIRDIDGKPHLVWQGQDANGRATLKSRMVFSDRLGPVRNLPKPAAFSGIIRPAPTAGEHNGVSAYGYANGRWHGILYEFGVAGKVVVGTRAYSSYSIRRPRMALKRGRDEVWVWPERSAADGSLLTSSSKNLAESLPDYVSPREASPQPAQDVVRILCFGDSITAGLIVDLQDRNNDRETEGYIKYLAELYGLRIAAVEIVQSGFSGEDTYEGLVRLPQVLSENWVFHFVLILEGTNDAFGGFLPEDVAENLGKMADMVRETGAIPIVATLLPRFDSPKKEIAEEISNAIYPMARGRGITICDFQVLFPKDRQLFSDLRLHPSDEGYAKMAGFWIEALVTFEGDIDRTFKVDQEDLLILTAILGSRKGVLSFNPDADFNDDGYIDVQDLSKLMSQLGKTF